MKHGGTWMATQSLLAVRSSTRRLTAVGSSVSSMTNFYDGNKVARTRVRRSASAECTHSLYELTLANFMSIRNGNLEAKPPFGVDRQ